MVEAGGRRGMLHITPRQIPRPQASQEPLAHSSCGMPVIIAWIPSDADRDGHPELEVVGEHRTRLL